MDLKKYKTLLPHYLTLLADKKCTYKQAAEATGYNANYLTQLKKRFLAEGFACLDHKPRNYVPKTTTPRKLKDKIVGIYSQNQYKDLNFKYFTECLNEYEDVKISLTTVQKIMKEYGIKSPEAHKIKRPKTHRVRVRRIYEGDLLQIDGTPFEWFYKFGNKKKFDLQGAIDDATGKITGLYLTENECLYGYMEVLRMTAKRHGLPREIYSDRAAIFVVTPKSKQDLTIWEELAGIHDKHTQWQRILDDLSIRQILAWSPQAKGRVERMWRTIQGRFPMWLFLNNIRTVEEANKRMGEFIDYFNHKFAIKAKARFPIWREPEENLDDILTAQIPRKTDSAGGFKFHSYKFHIKEAPQVANINFTLCISEHGIFARINNKYYPVELHDVIQYTVNDKMPEVLKNIIYRYLYAYAKEVSA